MEWAELRAKVALLSGLPDKLYEKALDYAFSLLQSELSLQLGLDDELAKLRRTRERISALLRDAEERRVIDDDLVLRWLRDLKDVALDAEDVADEFGARLRPPPGDSPGFSPAGARKRPWYAIASSPSPLIFFRRRVATEIAEINQRFDAISKDRKRLRLRSGEATRRVRAVEPPPTAGIFPDEPLVIGRDGDRAELLGLLVPEDKGDKGVFVVSVYGMAGMGKTTLAKYVFNDEKVMSRFESKRIWICATKGFDVVLMTKEILESLTGETCTLSNFDLMQCRVREQLMGKPFLLVLDDVRDDGPQHWEHLRVCLPTGKGESRVLITTRSEDVARRMGRVMQCKCLSGLSDDHCRFLFEQRVFPSGGLDGLPNLQKMAFKIARKCQGSPLAAVSLGGLLCNEKDEDEWRNVSTETAESSQGENDILPKLKLIYDHLPLHLKKCFAFCGIFPDGYLFDKDVLVKLWIAEGFIERRGTRRLETIGSKFFDELLWKSFFQVSDRTQSQKLKYKMPSLFHDLAQSVSRYECFKMVGNETKPHDASENARHTLLFCRSGETLMFTGFHKYKRLRTFSLKGDDRVGIRKLPSDLFLKLRLLRVLDLSDSMITELPDSIGELKLLRYLGLGKTWIKWLPESVATLCNLQTLELGDCYKLLELPEGTSNLVNLRHLGLHLDPHRGSNLTSMPPGIGKLSSLETLSRFIVGTKEGCGIAEIKNLNLRGELWISKLENVVLPDPEDASGAILCNKQSINALTLQWSDCKQEVDRVDVIEYLHPPSSLKYLCVDNYGGATVPDWLVRGSFSSLVNLRLSYCKQWKSCPPLGQLPALKELLVEGMHSMTSIEYQFPDSCRTMIFKVLEKLTLRDFPVLETLSSKEDVMPHLCELYISHCPELIDMSHLTSSLTKLAIKKCPKLLTLPPLPILQDLVVEACQWKVLDMVRNFTSLSSLMVSQISSLKFIPKCFFQPLTALKRLEITGCKELVLIDGNEGFRDLTSLEDLRILSCPELNFISSNGLPARLKDFRLCYCNKLTSIPWNLHDLAFLQHMEIRDIPWAMSLPQKGVSSSLQYLAISGCPFLHWRCRKDQGIDWPKIKDIFYIEIDFKVLSVTRGS
uniref:Putative disease resistance protein RGA1 n=1 Tax=Anthurium amnicola TaxID=1678845 RepID=A0A1D1YY68_9ARAE